MKALLALAMCVAFSGCHYSVGAGFGGTPEVTSKRVVPGDVIGTWILRHDGSSRTVTLTFKPDGTFTQDIAGDRGPDRRCPGGKWKLDGPRVHLSGYINQSNEIDHMDWEMRDDDGQPGGVILCGDDVNDPDSFNALTRIRH